MIPPDLRALAETVAQWADEAPGVPHVYVFGSRVRGDHHPGSDVDLCIIVNEMVDGDPTDPDDWWDVQQRASFADLTAVLPGPLEMHYDLDDPALRWMRDARADPARIVLQVRKAVCLWTPPKPARPLRARTTPQGQTLTPADYLASIVLPTLNEFTADPSDRRRAYLACIVAAHMLDHVARAMKKPQSDIRGAVRAQGAFAGECLDLVEGVCNGTKHAGPDRKATVQFTPGQERAFKANSLGGVLAAQRHRRWERPGLTVELPGKAEGDKDRIIDESIEGLIAACVMVFPDLFPGTDPLSVAPWLRPGDEALSVKE